MHLFHIAVISVFALCATVVTAAPGACADVNVTSFNVSSAVELKDAFACANANEGRVVTVALTDHITFDSGSNWDVDNFVVLETYARAVLEGAKLGSALTNITRADTAGKFRFFLVQGELTVNKLAFRNGYSLSGGDDYGGGAISTSGQTVSILIVSSCSFEANGADRVSSIQSRGRSLTRARLNIFKRQRHQKRRV